MPDAPLIVTLLVDDDAQQHFDALRSEHFPAERNYLKAHVTLFHALPAGRVNDVDRSVRDATRRAAFDLHVTGVRLLGRGVALDVEAPELTALHARLRAQWRPHLSRQDAQPLRPHVTVQNKVEPQDAKALLSELTNSFEPFIATGMGLDLWWYRGGPWEKARGFPFACP